MCPCTGLEEVYWYENEQLKPDVKRSVLLRRGGGHVGWLTLSETEGERQEIAE